MSYTNFKDALFAQAKAYGFSDWEVYYASGNSFAVKIFGGEIAEYKNTDSVGLSFRGTYNGRMGYAFTEKLDLTIIPSLIKNAAANAAVIEADEIEKLYPGDKTYPEVSSYNPALNDVSTKAKIDLALAMEKCTYNQDTRVKSIDYCQLGTSESTVNIANSYGLDLSNKTNFAYAYVVARVEDNGITKTGLEIWHGNDLSQFSYETLAQTAVERALSYLGAHSVESGTYPVIFDNRTACDLMAAFASVFFAENAQKGFSLLKGKEGEAIASPHITLRDDPEGLTLGTHKNNTFGGVAFDSEGVATKPKAVIENGVLKTLLYNTKSAAKDGTSSTGNGFKPSFRAAVATACTNFYLIPSDISPEKMRADIQRGILITEMAGLHAGINPISGDFSISSDGFLIEDGKITRPVEQITVAGNFYSLLKNIQCVGNDLRFDMPSTAGTFGMPSILIEALPVSGL
ncbi:MAG: TldD/PmbA family protein [Defluviitaleaceae bacterium]|nr:TldD/PmbA family protein [Defluviitaleaceae bacterium]